MTIIFADTGHCCNIRHTIRFGCRVWDDILWDIRVSEKFSNSRLHSQSDALSLRLLSQSAVLLSKHGQFWLSPTVWWIPGTTAQRELATHIRISVLLMYNCHGLLLRSNGFIYDNWRHPGLQREESASLLSGGAIHIMALPRTHHKFGYDIYADMVQNTEIENSLVIIDSRIINNAAKRGFVSRDRHLAA